MHKECTGENDLVSHEQPFRGRFLDIRRVYLRNRFDLECDRDGPPVDPIQRLGLRDVRIVERQLVLIDKAQTVRRVLEVPVFVVHITKSAGKQINILVLRADMVDLASSRRRRTVYQPNETLLQIKRK